MTSMFRRIDIDAVVCWVVLALGALVVLLWA